MSGARRARVGALRAAGPQAAGTAGGRRQGKGVPKGLRAAPAPRPSVVKAQTDLYVGRLRALRAIDEMVAAIGESREGGAGVPAPSG